MHQPITIARVRKATKITIPAGGYIVLVAPNVSFTEHAGARMKLAGSDTHELYSEVICGRIDNKYRDLKFLTDAEKKAQAQSMKDAEAAVKKNIEQTNALQKKRAAEEAAKKADDHKKVIAKINAENDAIANRKFPGASHVKAAEESSESENETDPELKTNGPTIAEFVSAGYDPKHYPPQGYAAVSTPEEVAKAVTEYNAKKNPPANQANSPGATTPETNPGSPAATSKTGAGESNS